MNVVKRDMVAVVTRGTMTDAEMLSRHPDASFLLALAEAAAPAAQPAGAAGAAAAAAAGGAGSCGGVTGDAQTVLGACAVDVATGQMLIGQW